MKMIKNVELYSLKVNRLKQSYCKSIGVLIRLSVEFHCR